MSTAQPYPPQPQTAPPKKKKRKWPWILGAVVLLFVLVGIFGGGADEATETAAQSETTTEAAEPVESAPAEQPEAAAPAAPAEEPEAPEESRSQANAIRSGENYLSFAPFSRDGLIQQLTVGDGYSTEDATYAVDNIETDYNEQAAKAAENYLDLTGFSRDGLVQQLTLGDGYTTEQAEFGATAAGL